MDEAELPKQMLHYRVGVVRIDAEGYRSHLPSDRFRFSYDGAEEAFAAPFIAKRQSVYGDVWTIGEPYSLKMVV